MMVLLGDEVTVSREVAGELTWVTGRVSGIVQDDHGKLRYFYIRGLDSGLWMSDGWTFTDDEIEEEEDNG